VTLGGWLLAKGARIADAAIAGGACDADFMNDKITTADYFAQHHLTQVPAMTIPVIEGGAAVLALDAERF